MNRSSDYSFVLNSLDNKINEALQASQAASFVSSGVKRKADDEPVGSNPKRHDTTSTMMLKHEIEELKLYNQQLQSELQVYQREHKLFKEDASKQLQILQGNNQQLKKQLEQAITKYDEAKKKWQDKFRDLEETKNSSKAASSAATTSAVPSMSATSAAQSELIDQLKRKMLSLEQQLSDYAIKYHALNKEKLELEHQVLVLQKDAQTHSMNVSHVQDEDASALRKQYSEIDHNYRKKCKEIDKLEARLKNQVMLEEELSSVQKKASLLEERIQHYVHMESAHTVLQNEHATWQDILQRVMGEKHSSVTSFLQYVQGLQEQHALSQQQISLHEGKLTTLRREYMQTQDDLRVAMQDKTQLEEDCKVLRDKADRISSSLKRQFEREVESLRNMLKTFDLEFSIGKVEVDKMLGMKDTVVEQLRNEVDALRGQNVELVEEREKLLDEQRRVTAELTLAKQTEKPSEASDEAQEGDGALNEQIQALKSDLQALQEVTGLDFLPHKTRILRLAQNPLDLTRNQPEAPSSLPQEQLARLRRENAQLLQQQQQIQQQQHHQQHQQEQSFGSTSSDSAASGDRTGVGAGGDGAGAGNMSMLAGAGGVDAMKLNQRLKEMFKERISTFRNAVYLLTGYKIDMIPSEDPDIPRIRLRSMYGERAEDCLIFQLRMEIPELLESEYADTLPPHLLPLLERTNGVPAFLANLTLDLYEAQTML